MKYKFCEQLKKSIFFDSNAIVHCCNCTQVKDTVFLENYKGEKIDWNKLIQEKLYCQQLAKEGKYPYKACEKCHMWREDDWDEGGYLNEIIISHWTACNCNCFYCYSAQDKQKFNSYKPYNLFEILQDLEKNNLLDFNKQDCGMVRFLGGDVAVLADFEEIINLFIKAGAKKIYIPTSGIKYIPVIEKVLKQGIAEVIVSPDSGNHELYKKIKRVDKYNQVRENMEKYAKAAQGNSVFKSKYIVLPYVNDKKEYIDEWLEECLNLGIKYIADDFEDNFVSKFANQIPKHIPELLDYIHIRADELNLKINRFRYASQLFYELENGIAKIAEDNSCIKEQKEYMENLLNR